MRGFRPRTPEEQKAFEDRNRQREAQELRYREQMILDESGIPTTHRECIAHRGGKWGEVLTGIESRIGSGFMFALVGTRGNGKTQMAAELVKEFARRGKAGRYTRSIAILTKIKCSYRQDSDESEEEIVAEYCKLKFLAIDEMGKRNDTDWETRQLFNILDCRYGDRLDTLLISNQTQTEFESSIGVSVVSRMKERGGVIVCDWESFR